MTGTGADPNTAVAAFADASPHGPLKPPVNAGIGPPPSHALPLASDTTCTMPAHHLDGSNPFRMETALFASFASTPLPSARASKALSQNAHRASL